MVRLTVRGGGKQALGLLGPIKEPKQTRIYKHQLVIQSIMNNGYTKPWYRV